MSFCGERNCRDYAGKSVAIIGCGSSAIQILPKMQKVCSNIDHYVRGKTYLSYPFGGDFSMKVIQRDMAAMNCTPHNTALTIVQYSEEEKKAFAEDPELYFKYRKEVERAINLDHACLFPGTDMQKA
jgi:cation diffusion facilitator CzcD-associated flavoprotein CzcO